MKNYLLIVLLTFIFIGCAQKEVVFTPKKIQQSIQKEENTYYQTPTVIEESPKPFSFLDTTPKIAIVFPSKIVGKYANGAINTVVSYLLTKNKEFKLSVIDSYDEDETNLIQAMNQLKETEYKKVILLFTEDSMPFLNRMSGLENLNIYMPLINKQDSILTLSNVTFGGIDYKKQISKLLELSNKKDALFVENTLLGEKLKELVSSQTKTIVLNTTIDRVRNDYKKIVTDPNLEN